MLQARDSVQFATPSQLLLLRGALCEGHRAEQAAQEWLRSQTTSAGLDLQGLDSGSSRLLSLLCQNVKECISDELRGQLRLVCLAHWTANQTKFKRLEKLLAWFQANRIPTLVLKGVALSILHYRNMALRPCADFDILVPEDQAAAVIKKLRSEGWKNNYSSCLAPQTSYFYQHIHAAPFTHADYGELDLHWHVLQMATFRGADRLFWNDSVPLQVNTIATRALNPTDQLLHACLHGFVSNLAVPIRWIADTVTVIRSSSVEWGRLLNLARFLRVTMPLALTLSFLEEEFSVGIPAQVIEELRAFPVHSSDQRYFSRFLRRRRGWQELFAYNYERHRRARPNLGPVARVALFPLDIGSFAFHRLLLMPGKLARGVA